jgi:hypothetical protein
MIDVTHILGAIRQAAPKATDELLPSTNGCCENGF